MLPPTHSRPLSILLLLTLLSTLLSLILPPIRHPSILFHALLFALLARLSILFSAISVFIDLRDKLPPAAEGRFGASVGLSVVASILDMACLWIGWCTWKAKKRARELGLAMGYVRVSGGQVYAVPA
ncbi:hypothetical protein HK097_004854 [Rhizophlyctis rosea]|uniref:Uncharacterized protein n=1 Tax=Rhizophlyctis rosea TaxID=64517 RepID=A0AAD5WYS3_9FUNG|nr:hypothetical protein HK097_004854 [Rhizophlyctis rosea]